MSEKVTTIQVLAAMLKKYNVKNVVASPGMQNAKFNAIAQEDSHFKCFSVVDERSAAYVATGLAFESQAPVAITCTGATSSRNYLPAMTEAYYRKLPIVAITFFNINSNRFNLAPQFVDRSVTQNDVKYLSVELPVISTDSDRVKCLVFLNAALSTAIYKKVPVHINCPADFDFSCVQQLDPEQLWKTEWYTEGFSSLAQLFEKKRVAVFIGSHPLFDQETEQAISKFATQFSVPVICDHTSGYRGCNKVLMSQVASALPSDKRPNLIIDMGGITGDYSAASYFAKASEVWRLSEDGSFYSRFNSRVTKLFACKEKEFFRLMAESTVEGSGYYDVVKEALTKFNMPDLPLSNALISSKLADYLPENCSLHLAILNSLRCLNFFKVKDSITINSNVGGFGIDGPVSTLVGQAFYDPKKLCFGLIGDLAFFYDMNALGNRDIKSNVRLIVVNNNRGEEFRLNPTLEKNLKEKTDCLIAAAGHHSSGAKGWAEACNFKYLCANTKQEFLDQIENFCNENYDQPVLFEVFTNDDDEKEGLKLIQGAWKVAPTLNVSVKKNLFDKISSAFSKR